MSLHNTHTHTHTHAHTHTHLGGWQATAGFGNSSLPMMSAPTSPVES